jgi:hypothetical protein
MTLQIRKAQRKFGKLRAAIGSPSGGGKTTQALLIAYGLVGPGKKIVVIDTERESADLYADDVGPKSIPVAFEVIPLSAPYSPERYIDAINLAASEKADALIIDSMTHEWSNVGGCLELVDQIAKAKYRGNSWSAWNEVTPRHRKFVDAILAFPGHVICTIRSKTETDQIEEGGRKKVVKLGMKNEQRDGTDYEFTLLFEIDHDSHYARATKDRTRLFPDPVMIDDASVGKRLREWLESGAKPAALPDDDPQLVAIKTAQTSEGLREVFGAAYKSAKGRGDEALAVSYKVAYDRRKTELEEAAAARLRPGATTAADEGGSLPDTSSGGGIVRNAVPDPGPANGADADPALLEGQELDDIPPGEVHEATGTVKP